MMIIPVVKFDTKYDQILQNYSQKPSMSSMYDCVLGALLIMLGSLNFEYSSEKTIHVDLWCQI